MIRRISTRVVQGVARTLARRDLDLAVEGLAHVPRDGPVILATRHVHHLYDGVALLAALPRPVHVMVGLDWVRTTRLRRVMEAATALARWPVVLRSDALTVGPDGHPRNTGGAFRPEELPRYQLRAMRTALDLLAAGRVVAVFPEAYPNVDPGYTPKHALDDMLPFRPGFAAMADLAFRHRAMRVPIVPTGLHYRAGRRWSVALRFGAPLAPHGSRSRVIAEAEDRVAALSARRPSSRPTECRRRGARRAASPIPSRLG
jgi:putative membrane protein